MRQQTQESIKQILLDCITASFSRVSTNQTFRPFHEALLSKEIIKASAFERSFSTSFGQGPIEKISQLLALDRGDHAERQKETMANTYKGALDQIERILSDLRAGNRTPNWSNEVRTILAVNRGDTDVRRVISDLYIRREQKDIFISIKTVKPNLDQAEIAKRDMFTLLANDPTCETYLGLYYNPGGPDKYDYNWTMPFKIFNMREDKCVLIGKGYWDLIGGTGTYEELLQLFAEVGETTVQRFIGFFK